VAAFVAETSNMDTPDVERDVIERQAEAFEQEKGYLLERMDRWPAAAPV
jgi:hypothetical protein